MKRLNRGQNIMRKFFFVLSIVSLVVVILVLIFFGGMIPLNYLLFIIPVFLMISSLLVDRVNVIIREILVLISFILSAKVIIAFILLTIFLVVNYIPPTTSFEEKLTFYETSAEEAEAYVMISYKLNEYMNAFFDYEKGEFKLHSYDTINQEVKDYLKETKEEREELIDLIINIEFSTPLNILEKLLEQPSLYFTDKEMSDEKLRRITLDQLLNFTKLALVEVDMLIQNNESQEAVNKYIDLCHACLNYTKNKNPADLQIMLAGASINNLSDFYFDNQEFFNSNEITTIIPIVEQYQKQIDEMYSRYMIYEYQYNKELLKAMYKYDKEKLFITSNFKDMPFLLKETEKDMHDMYMYHSDNNVIGYRQLLYLNMEIPENALEIIKNIIFTRNYMGKQYLYSLENIILSKGIIIKVINNLEVQKFALKRQEGIDYRPLEYIESNPMEVKDMGDYFEVNEIKVIK